MRQSFYEQKTDYLERPVATVQAAVLAESAGPFQPLHVFPVG
jgi:hypothetical protein